jgi:hypothetical protein
MVVTTASPKHASASMDGFVSSSIPSIIPRRHSSLLLSLVSFLVVKQLISPSNHMVRRQLEWSEPVTKPLKWTEPVNFSPPRYTVFYNIFVSPANRGMTKLGIAIVRDQLSQLSSSFAASVRRRNGTDSRLSGEVVHENPLDVYYITIGVDNVNETVVAPQCEEFNLNCFHLQHYDQAHEEKILSALHQFCKEKNEQGEDHSVIYIHTKGSFNPRNGIQEELRRAGTAAVTSELCLKSIEDQRQSKRMSSRSFSSEKCVACGLLFQPLPDVHFPGNFFTAKCSYISKLLSPVEFNNITDAFKESGPVLEASGTENTLYRWGPGNVGFDRYANEREYTHVPAASKFNLLTDVLVAPFPCDCPPPTK